MREENDFTRCLKTVSAFTEEERGKFIRELLAHTAVSCENATEKELQRNDYFSEIAD